MTAAFSYAHSKGVFIGVSLEAATVVTRKDANRDFYGTKVSAEELLLGGFPAPKAAEPLYQALEEVRACVRACVGSGVGWGVDVGGSLAADFAIVLVAE